MNIQESKMMFPAQLKESYTNDVKRLVDFFFELKLDQYPVNVTIHHYINEDGIATVDLELIKEIVSFHYLFAENSIYDRATLSRNTETEKLFFPLERYADESDEEFIERCEEEGDYSFEDVLAETKKVVNAYIQFMDSIN